MDQEYRREPCSIRLDNSASFRPAACGVVIGATKCGTTSFYRALASHPFVCPSRMKELNVFLEEVIDFYNQGGEKNPWLSSRVKKLNLSDQEKKDLVEFLKSLNGKVTPVDMPSLPK